MKKKRFTGFLAGVAFLAAAVILGGAPSRQVFAKSATKDQDVSVAKYGAKPGDQKDDVKAIQQALSLAMDASGTVTVRFATGVYLISEPLHIYSNTHVIMEPGTVIRMMKKYNKNTGGTMFYATHVNDEHEDCYATTGCKHKGYDHTQNVTIEGGTLDGNKSNSGLMTNAMIFRHANNITVKNVTCINFTRHVLNMSGSANVTIMDSTIRDCDNYTGKGNIQISTEVIHLDFITKSGEAAYPVDGTPPKNVLIKNCVFQNVNSGIGTHHTAENKNKPANGITIENCTFKNYRGFCIGLGDSKNVKVTGCTHDGSTKYFIRTFGNNAKYKETGTVNLAEITPTPTPDPELEETVVTPTPAPTSTPTPTPAPQKLTVSPKTVTLKVGKSKTLKIKAVPAGKITVKSSDPKVVKVTKAGKITGKKKGKATVTITCNGKSVKVKVTVKK